MHHYPHHIGDFRSGTVNMTRQERWIYRDMLDVYYDLERPLPLDQERLCHEIGVRADEEKKIVTELLRFKFEKSNDGYHHRRCDAEIAIYHSKAETAKENGKLGGRPKKNRNLEKPSGFILGSDSVATANPGESGSEANQEPRTNLITTNVVIAARNSGDDAQQSRLLIEEAPEDTAFANCPHQKIIDLYHEVLPMCPRIRDWTAARATQLRARWNEDKKRQNLEYWRGLFEYILSCNFLIGNSGNKPFFADLEWITKSKNFVKIREGKYEDRN